VTRSVVFIVIVLTSLGLGLASAWLAAQAAAPIDSLQLGSWSTWPNAGTANTDPYSRARLARHGELPLGAGEGLALYASSDDRGNPLLGRCAYVVEGQTPPARLWTLTLEMTSAVAAGLNRSAIGSDKIVRNADGSFEIAIAPAPKPGNWLTSADAVRSANNMRIVVRLYDTTARTLTELTDFSMPSIRLRSCP
jgi:hypothetical protein